MSDVDLTHLRDLLAKATPGEWFTEPETMAGRVWVAMERKWWPKADIEPLFQVRNSEVYEQRENDAALIVALVNAAPALLDALGPAAQGGRMSDARDTLRQLCIEYGLGQGSAFHSWRCDYPDRYGECDCLDEFVTELVKRDRAVEQRALRDAANAMTADRSLTYGDALVVQWLNDRANTLGEFR